MTTSWIIRNKLTQEVICETFIPKLVDALNTEKYEAVPILDYLSNLNYAENAQAAVDASRNSAWACARDAH